VLALEGGGIEHYAVDLLSPGFSANFSKVVKQYVNPIPPIAASAVPTRCGTIVSANGWGPGGLSGKFYGPGEGVFFDTEEQLADLASRGIAEYTYPNADTDRLLTATQKRLAQRPAFDSANDTRVDLGWTSNDVA
jgi:hypothetical protein